MQGHKPSWLLRFSGTGHVEVGKAGQAYVAAFGIPCDRIFFRGYCRFMRGCASSHGDCRSEKNCYAIAVDVSKPLCGWFLHGRYEKVWMKLCLAVYAG